VRFPSPPPYASQRSAVMAENMVVASQPLAGQAGLSMLANGGNAVDAVLAAAITLTQVEPTGNGLGSDAFAILWDGKQLHGLNASGRSPATWNAERFAKSGRIPDRGWETVTVPGAVAGWVELHCHLKHYLSRPFVTQKPVLSFRRLLESSGIYPLMNCNQNPDLLITSCPMAKHH